MEQYRTTGILSTDALNEIGKHLLPRRSKILAAIFTVLFTAVSLLNFMAGNTGMGIICAAGIAVFLFEPLWLRKRIIKRTSARLLENYPDGFCRHENFCTAEGISLHNLTSGASVLMRYENLARAAETEHYFFIVSKSSQFLLIFKDCLSQEQRESFPSFLKERCPKLKIFR